MAASILFIHGMSCTGDVWRNYREYFGARGFDVHTPTLRPELRTRRFPPADIRQLRFASYIDEMTAAARAIEADTGQLPVVVGHSMGGLIAQGVAERGAARALLLLSPAPPSDCVLPRVGRFWSLFSLGLAAGVIPRGIYPVPAFVNNMVFNATDPSHRRGFQRAMVHESSRAFSDMRTVRIDHDRMRLPIHIVACGKDRMVPAGLVKAVARKYKPVGASFQVYPQHGHWIYDEPGWEGPAEDLHRWLQQQTA